MGPCAKFYFFMWKLILLLDMVNALNEKKEKKSFWKVMMIKPLAFSVNSDTSYMY